MECRLQYECSFAVNGLGVTRVVRSCRGIARLVAVSSRGIDIHCAPLRLFYVIARKPLPLFGRPWTSHPVRWPSVGANGQQRSL
jgi:hypothetical protein